MQTVLDILKNAGWHPGPYLKIDNAPYMELVIEAMDESGPTGYLGRERWLRDAVHDKVRLEPNKSAPAYATRHAPVERRFTPQPMVFPV